MKKIQTYVLLGLTLFLTASCGRVFVWEARPFVADYRSESIISKERVQVMCNDPSFNDYICFHHTNIAELKAAIDNLRMRKHTRYEINKAFGRFYGTVNNLKTDKP